MDPIRFKQIAEANGLLHPPSCCCSKCSAGRESRELSETLRDRVKDVLDGVFLEQLHHNLMGGFQALAQGNPMPAVRSAFLGTMAHIFTMREMAFAYFAEEKAEEA